MWEFYRWRAVGAFLGEHGSGWSISSTRERRRNEATTMTIESQGREFVKTRLRRCGREDKRSTAL
jgi:hypothetical protein